MRERVILLCRERNPQVETLRASFAAVADVRIVEDRGPLPPGYSHLSHHAKTPLVTAWDRAFVDIEPVDTWFCEDDVAGSPAAFAELLATCDKTQDLLAFRSSAQVDDPGWPLWDHAAELPGEPRMAFCPLCRLSGALIQQVLDYRTAHGRFTFLEVLFPMLATSIGEFRNSHPRLFGEFRYRMHKLRPQDGRIVHPVKNAERHRLFCSAPLPPTLNHATLL